MIRRLIAAAAMICLWRMALPIARPFRRAHMHVLIELTLAVNRYEMLRAGQ